MATNFPGSQDSFTNPTSSDNLDSPDHAAQHTNVNDAVEAIELALLDGAPLYIDDTNERVGIGDTTPSYKLDVNGTGRFTGALDADTQINLGSALHLTQADADGSMRVQGDNGYIDIGPKNSSYAHIYTDRASFYFNKESLYANSTDHKIWHRGDLRGSATTISVNSTGYGSISHSLGQTPDFAFVGARTTLSSDGDNQLAFPITSYSSSTITFRAYEINGSGNSNYTSSTIYNASVYVFWMAGFFS